MDDLLKPSDIVRRLGTSRSWVYQAAKNGDIPSIRLAGEDGPLRCLEQDIESWIDDARARWRPGRPPVATRRQVSNPPTRSPPAHHTTWTQLKLVP